MVKPDVLHTTTLKRFEGSGEVGGMGVRGQPVLQHKMSPVWFLRGTVDNGMQVDWPQQVQQCGGSQGCRSQVSGP